uniref:dihydrodipicolinate synthase family protein n=1 Tax=uncultured Shimia sp. TaxID=573152 RepID=UPI0025F36EBE
GVKHTSLNLYQFERLLSKTGTQGYYGHDEQFLSALALQPYGFIGSTIGIMPHVYRNIAAALAAGDFAAARNGQAMANDVIDALMAVGVLPGVKAILAMDGVDCGQCRAPLGQPSPEQINLLKRVMTPVWQARNDSEQSTDAAPPRREKIAS